MANPSSILSASKIKTLESCSWKYWCNYHLQLPQIGNDGARRGTVCHLVFEVLVRKRHHKHALQIIKSKNFEDSPAVKRLVIKSLKKEGALNEENYELCEKMIVVGLSTDFYCKGSKKISAEQEFLLESKNPTYKIRGFIDKPAQYKNALKIIDYKSSKSKFSESELDSNFQGMAYTLAARKLWPKLKKVIVEFLFLRFPRKPSQQIEFNEDQIKGF